MLLITIKSRCALIGIHLHGETLPGVVKSRMKTWTTGNRQKTLSVFIRLTTIGDYFSYVDSGFTTATVLQWRRRGSDHPKRSETDVGRVDHIGLRKW